MSNDNTNTTFSKQSEGDDEIDLRQVSSALGRHLRLIAAITGSSLLLSAIHTYGMKPVWEGQFQIVLGKQDSSNNGRLLNSFPAIHNFFLYLVGASH